MYIDGSAPFGTTSGGAAMSAAEGDPAITHMPRIRGDELASSYEEEKIRPPPASLSAYQYALTGSRY